MTNPEIAKQYRTREPVDKIRDRKAKFERLNALVMSRNAWLISIPGDEVVRLECLEGSALPQELTERGYDLHPDAPGERILPVGVTENIPITPGSSTTRQVQHAGICRTQRWHFEL